VFTVLLAACGADAAPPVGEHPQLVALTFDDNFGLAAPGAVGGVNDLVELFRGRTNADGTAAHATFFHTSIYVVDEAEVVLGGMPGEDRGGRNRAAWTAAFEDGHEAADHTVNHFNGGVVPLDPDPCCQARDWDAAAWRDEIAGCRDALGAIGARPEDVTGFRAPFLGYNDHLFEALTDLGFAYDSSLPNCFADDEDGTNCSWPYELADGSPDLEVVARKFPDFTFPEVTSHPGVWELPPTTLVIPPDLRDKVTARAPLPYPSLYEPSSGKIAGLDYTLLIDAGLTGDEMATVLEHNLDLHLAGNRAPLIFVAHAHLYAFSSASDNPDTPSLEVRDERMRALARFVDHALSKPEVRLVATREVLEYVRGAWPP
jgi:peptidoglycan/xylan/chitin deacetylase (PgdA/CDA1 family)